MSQWVAFRVRSNESQTISGRNKELLPKDATAFPQMFPKFGLKDISLIDEQRTAVTMDHNPDMVKATKKLCLSTFLSLYTTFTIVALNFKPILILGAAANAPSSSCSTIESFHHPQYYRRPRLLSNTRPVETVCFKTRL